MATEYKSMILRQGGRTDYNYKEWYLDTEADLQEISEEELKSACTGSVAYVIATGNVYMLNSEKEWIAQ